ncbi:hypothetical protein AGMMS50268_26180 [Spirochaetia bacterium]|nr:hypothetical protein AGMMS50268_26180 [Spirochaetia bacterium]
MKKTMIFALFLGIMVSAINAQENSQKVKQPRFSFQVSPLIYLVDLLILGIDDDPERYFVAFDFEFQYAINDYFNISINPQLFLDKDGNDSKQTQFLITSGLLFRPFKSKLKGMYIGAYFPIGWENISREGYSRQSVPSIDDNFTILGIGASTGYQWIFKNGFTVALGGGMRKHWYIASKNNKREYPEAVHLFKFPLNLDLTFRLGYSF